MAFLSEEIIYPALIGNDIGCGMTLFDLGIPVRKLKTDKLLRKLGGDPETVIRQLSQKYLNELDATMDDSLGMLGTLGHGNHFAEILEMDAALDVDACQELALHKGNALLLIHSGSRPCGEALWRDFAAKHGDKGISAALAVSRLLRHPLGNKRFV